MQHTKYIIHNIKHNPVVEIVPIYHLSPNRTSSPLYTPLNILTTKNHIAPKKRNADNPATDHSTTAM